MTPVKEVAQQLVLSFVTAVTSNRKGDAGGGRHADRSSCRKSQGPKTIDKSRKCELANGGDNFEMKRGLRNVIVPNGGSYSFTIISLGQTIAPIQIFWIGIPRGRDPASDGGNNPSFRRAVCEQHKYGSVGSARGNPGCLPDGFCSSGADSPVFFLRSEAE